jgi:hypothetical protein
MSSRATWLASTLTRAADVFVDQEPLARDQVQDEEHVGEVHVAQTQREGPSGGRGGAAARRRLDRGRTQHGDAAAVAVDHAGRIVLAERIVDGGQRQLRLDADDGAAAADLEAMAAARARHQDLRYAEEPALQSQLQCAHGTFPDGEAADHELVAEDRVLQHDRPVAHDRGQLGEEEPRVASRTAQARHRVRFRQGQGLIAQELVGHRPRDLAQTRAQAFGGWGQRRARGPVREVEERGEAHAVAGPGGKGEGLHVDEPRGERDLAEEAIDLGEPRAARDVDGHVALRALLQGRPRADVEPHSRRAREIVEEGDVVRRRGPVRQHSPQRLQAAVQEQAFFGEGTNGGSGQEQQAEEGSHRGRC